MRLFELTKGTVSLCAGDSALPRAAQIMRENGCVPVVDAQGRITGVLIDDDDIRLAWRAEQGALSDGIVRVLDLIANDVSAFFLREDGVVQQRVPEGRGDDHAVVVDGCSLLGSGDMGAFMRHARSTEGYALRERSESFEEHYRHATHFWNTLSVRERAHLVLEARFELGKVESKEVWRRAIAQFRRVDRELARRVARGLWHPHGAPSVIDLLPRR